uniref:Uncharacterized protein n=1 Tax=Octopus bimaculoides TaxID=37653 RepID=A0A0L8HA64_OCTBM
MRPAGACRWRLIQIQVCLKDKYIYGICPEIPVATLTTQLPFSTRGQAGISHKSEIHEMTNIYIDIFVYVFIPFPQELLFLYYLYTYIYVNLLNENNKRTNTKNNHKK